MHIVFYLITNIYRLVLLFICFFFYLCIIFLFFFFFLFILFIYFFFFFQAEDGIRDLTVTGVQTCALPICRNGPFVRNAPFQPEQRVPDRREHSSGARPIYIAGREGDAGRARQDHGRSSLAIDPQSRAPLYAAVAYPRVTFRGVGCLADSLVGWAGGLAAEDGP